MKVIQILHHSLTPFNPGEDVRNYEESWHVKVAKQLKKSDPSIDLECWRPEKSLDKPYKRIGDEGIIHRIFPSYFVNSKLEYSPRLISELKRETSQENVIVHLHGIYNFFTYMIIRCIKSTPIIAQSHGGLPSPSSFKEDGLLKKISSLIEFFPQKNVFPYVNCFHSLTEYENKQLSKHSSSRVSPMGVDFDDLYPLDEEFACEKLNINQTGKFRINYLGRLVNSKGVDLLLKASKILGDNGIDVEVNIAGSGPERGELENEAARLGVIDNVNFWGFISQEEKLYYYNIANVVCFPSRQEPYGIVPVEALACKTPVVASKVGGVTTIADSFKSGSVLVEPDNHMDLAQGLKEAITNPVTSSDIDRKSGKENHSWESIISNTVDEYNSIVKDK